MPRQPHAARARTSETARFEELRGWRDDRIGPAHKVLSFHEEVGSIDSLFSGVMRKELMSKRMRGV
jgi:hypothetical protein